MVVWVKIEENILGNTMTIKYGKPTVIKDNTIEIVIDDLSEIQFTEEELNKTW